MNVILIPGIGTPKTHKKAYILQRKLYLKDDYAAKVLEWQSAVNESQAALFRSWGQLGYKWLREFSCHYISDAISYQNIRSDTYYNIHNLLGDFVRRSEGPFWIIGHSLGGIIAQHYLWDCLNEHSKGRLKYFPSVKEQNLVKNNFAGLITLGCPTAIWGSSYEDGGKPCTPKPIYNIWAQSDPLSSPIKNLGKHYLNHESIEDIKVSPGLTHWLPTSHNNYWQSSQVYGKVKSILCNKIN